MKLYGIILIVRFFGYTFIATILFFNCVAVAAPMNLGRYQSIVDRMPFGALPADFNPNAPAPGRSGKEQAAEEAKLKASIRLCALNVTPAGLTAVGFTDTSANPNANYYLIVGQSQNGWTVSDANPENDSATLEKDGFSITLKLGDTTNDKDIKKTIAENGPAHMPVAYQEGMASREVQPTPRRFAAGLAARRAKQQAEKNAAEEKLKAAEALANAERAEQRAKLDELAEEIRREREERARAAANNENVRREEIPE